MKKKFLISLLCISLGLLAVSCGKNEVAQGDDAVYEDGPNETDEATNHTSEEVESPENVETNDSDYNHLPAVIVDDEYFVDIFVDGKDVKICNLDDEKDTYYYSSKDVFGDHVYIIKNTYNSDDNPVLEVYDLEGNKEFDYVFEKFAVSIRIEEYEGDVFVSYQTYNNLTYEYGDDYKVYKYSPDTRDFDYSKTYSELLTKAGKAGVLFPNYEETLFYSLRNDDKTVYAWDSVEKAFASLDPFSMEIKEKVPCDIADKEPYCCDFWGDLAVLYVTSDYDNGDYYVADMKTGKTECILSGEYNYISTVGGVMYYYPEDTDSYINKKYEVHSIDLKTKESKKLYECQGKAGDKYVTAGITGFTVKDNLILFRDTDENGFFWRVYDLKQDKLIDDKLGFLDGKYGKFATVESYDAVKRLKVGDREQIYFNEYVEKVILNDTIKNYEVINEDLEKLYEEQLDYAKRCEDDSRGWLDDVEDFSYFIASFYDLNLNSITEIGSHYLQVDFGAYEYFGGAHGYGYEVTRLYDVNTGKAVVLKDLCGVDFETFKELLISKTIDDWKESDEYKYYISYDGTVESETEFYNTLVEDIVDFEVYPVFFKEDCVVVSYPPYVYGSYATGYIPIEISYEELGMNMNQ